MIELLVASTLTLSPLFGDTISSKQAGYDGNVLILNGEVELDHALGSMQAQFARLEKTDKEGPFTAILLKDGVTITLKEHGSVSCNEADLDLAKRIGRLLPKAGEKIVFHEDGTEPFTLSSRWAEVEFAESGEEVSVSLIKAIEDVQVDYGSHLSFTAERATYFPSNGEGRDQKIAFLAPTGVFTPPSNKKDPVTFACDQMIWHPGSQSLTLQGDVSVGEESFGQLVCDEEVVLNQVDTNGEWTLSTIVAKGKTEFVYETEEGENHHLSCQGTMLLDREALTLTLSHPANKAIEYQSGEMKLIADEAKMHFREEKRGKEVDLLTLTGNILLTSAKEARPTRCALADTFSYSPDKQSVILKTKSGASVLFWDAEEELSISAREVHITRSETGDNIKGVGNVHFSFSTAESELLHKLFPFYKGGSHGR